jgi:TM2 domain-containing membrane protein YozV
MTTHNNKTFATFLAFAFGSAGMHRFYLYGKSDPFAWLYLASIPVALIAIQVGSDINPLFMAIPWIVAILASQLEAFTLGLKEDARWDAIHNPSSGKTSDSHWIIAVVLCVNLMVVFTVLIAFMARASDLVLTGGAFG